jgi:small subunit ribosomal protein S6
MRVYEELFIVKPDTPEEEVDAFVEQIQQVITNGKGTIDKTDKWGMRKLAYRVQKYGEGIYILIQFTSSPDLVKEVERRMRVADQVIKFITVRIDEKIKKIEKRKKARDKRAARRPAPQMAAPAIPVSPAMPAEPATIAPGLPGAPTSSPAHVVAPPVVAHPAPAAPVATAPEPAVPAETKE